VLVTAHQERTVKEPVDATVLDLGNAHPSVRGDSKNPSVLDAMDTLNGHRVNSASRKGRPEHRVRGKQTSLAIQVIHLKSMKCKLF